MTISLTSVVQAGASPTVKLTAASTTSAPSPVPNNTRISVVRVHADGSEHVVMTESSPRLVGGSWVWLDTHCPYNQAVTYRITANGFSATSAAVWLLSTNTWLLHPTRADLAVMVEAVSAFTTRTRSSRSAKFTPIGGKAVFLTNGARDGVKGSISFRVSKANEHLYDELIDDDSVILVNTPNTPGWDIGWMWIQPGEVSFDNKANLTKYPYREVSFPFEESADPTVVLEPVWTAGAAAAYWASQGVNAGQMATKYATAGDLTTDTRL